MRNDIDIDSLKKKLEEERDTLHSQLSEVGRQNPKNPDDWQGVREDLNGQDADPNEAADTIESFEENKAITEELEVRFNGIKDALERIEAGTYGFCEVGGEPIEADRLEANPSATTCKAHMNG